MKNQPAFPVVGMNQQSGGQQFIGVFEQGMTLRDYFAGQIIMGIMAAVTGDRPPGALNWETEVKMAYRIADQMLDEKERLKPR